MNRIASAAASALTPDLRRLLGAACKAALTGGSILRDLYGKPHTITMKGAINLVTEADLASERAVFDVLGAETPGIPIMGEEDTSTHVFKSLDRVWVVDPLDGTTNFAHGFPFFAVSVGLLEQGRPIVAAVYAPMSDELFWASKNSGAWLNNSPIRVSFSAWLIESLVGTGFPYERQATLPAVMRRLQLILANARDIRRTGSAALDLANVACGRLDGFYEINLQPWDTAAGWLLVEEAGGTVSDFAGAPYSVFFPEILASNSALHRQLLDLIR